MRIQPPKTKAKSFNTNSKSFEEYILNHCVVFEDGSKENALRFFERHLLASRNYEDFLNALASLWPEDYRPYVKRVFLIKLKDYFVDDTVKKILNSIPELEQK